MELFVVNRYTGDNTEVDLIHQETAHLQKLKQKIDERKKAHVLHNNKVEEITLKSKNDSITVIDSIEVDTHETKESEEQSVKSKKSKSSTEFKVLGNSDFSKQTKVQRVLPYWLSHAGSVSTDLQNLSCAVEHLPWLHDTLKNTLLSEGVTHLFPVQEKVIPFILDQHTSPQPLWPSDICVSAPTGSGKTLSFVLPIVQVLMKEVGRQIRALIVLPVQELAAQVAKVFKKYCAKSGLTVALLSALTPLNQEQRQIVRYTETAGWISEVDIIVCTAGRLVEHIQSTEGFSLKYLKFLVIDEADRIMDHIQNDWLYHMEKHIESQNEFRSGKISSLSWNNLCTQNAPPHKLLFSATLSQDPEKLQQWDLFQPKLFSAAPINKYEDSDHIRKYTTPAELKEQFVTCSAEEKPVILYHFLVEQKWDKVLCFTKSAQSAHRLTVLLNVWTAGHIRVAELSAALDRSTRESVLKKFTRSEIKVLIGTDALARGIDVQDCNYVISYDPPHNIKTYIHRVGRTGRAGRQGQAVTFLTQNQLSLFKDLIQSGGKSELPQLSIDDSIVGRLSGEYENAIRETKMIIDTETNKEVKKSIELKRGMRHKAPKRKHE